MSLTPAEIDEAVARYEREYDRFVKLAEVVYQRCQEILARTSVRATVQRRAKSPTSLRRKLESAMKDPEKAARFTSVPEVFAVMSDLAGVRVATYLESDRDRIVKEINAEFVGPKTAESPEVDVKDGKSKSPHYRATHCQVRIADDELPEGAWNLKGAACEVQVCSLLAHVWNEVEHDLKYKPMSGELGDVETDLLDQLAQLTRAGDISIRQLLAATDKRLAERTGKFADVHDFVARMRNEIPGATNFGDNAGQLMDELGRLGLETPGDIRAAILDNKPADSARAQQLVAKLKAYLAAINEKDSVDPTSSDLLLALLLERKGAEIVGAHLFGTGKGRPSRLVFLARRFQEMQKPAPAQPAQPAQSALPPATA